MQTRNFVIAMLLTLMACGGSQELEQNDKTSSLSRLSILDLVSAPKICPFFAYLMANYGAMNHSISLNFGMTLCFREYFDQRKFQH